MARTLTLILLAMVLVAKVHGDSVQRIRTFTSSCLGCGMSAGDISIKVCGNVDCCLSMRLDNDNINFISGQTDVFEGAATLKECDNFQIGNKELGQIQISLTHEGSDGVTLDAVEIDTDERTVRCPIGFNLDRHEWEHVLCF